MQARIFPEKKRHLQIQYQEAIVLKGATGQEPASFRLVNSSARTSITGVLLARFELRSGATVPLLSGKIHNNTNETRNAISPGTMTQRKVPPFEIGKAPAVNDQATHATTAAGTNAITARTQNPHNENLAIGLESVWFYFATLTLPFNFSKLL